jgi:alpha-D-ribose 1-methylphosphonate 5-triphosphate diphosphatase
MTAAKLPPLRFTGAEILRDGEMQRRSVALADGRITRGPLPEVDLSGYLILPGIIDLHGDGFEHHLAPRPSARLPYPMGLASADREAAVQGVTTSYLAQGWSWEGAHRSPEVAEALMAALAAYRPRALTDLRIQIRAETHLPDCGPRLLAAVRRYGVDYVVFNDHLPEGLAMANGNAGRFAVWASKLGQTGDELLGRIKAAHDHAPHVDRALHDLAEAFDRLGVHYGSHDDSSGEQREYFARIGARIAEFPLNTDAASAAKSMMNPVIMGAPNVVRGGSQSGNIAATELIAAGLCDALVSDYHLPTLYAAAWILVDRGILSLPKAWAMISTNPAAILHMADRGRLEPGLRADMVVVNAETRAIEATISGGRLVHLSGEAALRFLRVPQAVAMAAE